MTVQLNTPLTAAQSASAESSTSGKAAPELSVVVPLCNQGANVWPLVFGLRTALGTMSTEVLFVDDSDDDTPQVVHGVADMMEEGRSDFRLRLLHREPEQRRDGREGAVEAGLAHAEAAHIVVMDSDLEHPPALVAVLLDRLHEGADVVVAGHRAEQDLSVLPGFFGITREALHAPTLNVVELPF